MGMDTDVNDMAYKHRIVRDACVTGIYCQRKVSITASGPFPRVMFDHMFVNAR